MSIRDDDEIPEEIDFSAAVRARHYERFKNGNTIHIVDTWASRLAAIK